MIKRPKVSLWVNDALSLRFFYASIILLVNNTIILLWLLANPLSYKESLQKSLYKESPISVSIPFYPKTKEDFAAFAFETGDKS